MPKTAHDQPSCLHITGGTIGQTIPFIAQLNRLAGNVAEMCEGAYISASGLDCVKTQRRSLGIGFSGGGSSEARRNVMTLQSRSPSHRGPICAAKPTRSNSLVVRLPVKGEGGAARRKRG